ncbi:hypothetical protein ACPF4W_002548 [Vibrio cholerae]
MRSETYLALSVKSKQKVQRIHEKIRVIEALQVIIDRHTKKETAHTDEQSGS